MTRDEEIKLKVATIIDEAVGEKKKSRRRFLVWAGFACAAMLISSIAFAHYLNKPPPGSGTSRQFMIQGYTKNIPVERPYIWLIVDENNLSLIFHEFDSYICPSVPMKVIHSGVMLSRHNRGRECLITKQMGESGLPLGENFLAKTFTEHHECKL